MKLSIEQFRVLNYRNIDDSGWIPLERVTAFVGRNESGKTALLKALHKFNPAVEEPYNAQREFPRDRFTAEYKDGADWPVCQVKFSLSDEYQDELTGILGKGSSPTTAIVTRYYDGGLTIEYDTELPPDTIPTAELSEALDSFRKGAGRLKAPAEDQEEATQQHRTNLANWADQKKAAIGNASDLRTTDGIALLQTVTKEANGHSNPITADLVDELKETVDELLKRAKTQPLSEQLEDSVTDEMPVFIYFENYGILDSAVYLPRFLEDLNKTPDDPRIRTINAMFKHVQLSAEDIAKLGRADAERAAAKGENVTDEMVQKDQQNKELRSVKLNSASLDISNKFNDWFGQRRHKIRYQADGDYFRIWVSDDRRPDVDIELESRSKGFQWFFSFYLVFLVESEEGHKDAMLLLDEPGLHLHPTAQQELIAFFERLSEINPLMYTTHSPFLVDGDRIHRVRPVTEDETGHSRISVDSWPKDRETIFPLQAAAGYAMVRGLFQNKKNVLVEGMADYLYLHNLNLQCHATARHGLPDDIYITPCGGTKYVGHIASLFLGQEVRPVVLLDGDEAGRARRDALMKELYTDHEKAVMLLDEVFGNEDYETEDLIGEEAILATLKEVVGKKLTLNKDDRGKGALVDQIESSAIRHGVALPEGWKPEVARRIAVQWSTMDPSDIPAEILDRAEKLFRALTNRF